jgi:hypothetical protein
MYISIYLYNIYIYNTEYTVFVAVSNENGNGGPGDF